MKRDARPTPASVSMSGELSAWIRTVLRLARKYASLTSSNRLSSKVSIAYVLITGLARSVSDSSAPISPIRSLGAAEAARVVDDRKQDERRQEKHEEGEPRIERKDVDQQEQERQRPLHEVRKIVPEGVLNLLNVGQHPAHQIARGALGVEACGLVKETPVGVAPQIAHHRDTDSVQFEFGEIGKETLREERDEQQHRHGVPYRDSSRLRGLARRRVSLIQPPEQRTTPGGGGAAQPAERLRGARTQRVVEDSADQI